MSATVSPPAPAYAAVEAGRAARAAANAKSQLAKIEQLRFRTAPLLFAAIAFAVGIAVAHGCWIAPAPAACAVLFAVLTAAFALFCCRARVALVPLAAVWLLLGIIAAELQPAPAQQRELAQLADATPRAVTAEIVKLGPVRQITSAIPFTDSTRTELSRSLDLRVHSVAGEDGQAAPVSGGIRLSIYGPVDQPLRVLGCGDAVQVVMTLRTPERYRDPGVWDSGSWLLSQGIGALGSAKAGEVNIVQRAARSTWPCRLHTVQQLWSDRLMTFADEPARLPRVFTLGHDDAAMLSAMLTGDRTYLSRAIRVGFERTGSFHLLVVSGLHLGLFAGCVLTAARRLRLPRVLATAVTLLLASGYSLLTGFGQPVRRALFMVALYLIGRLLFRERSSLNAIGFAALCLLVISPRSPFDASLQMTLLSIIAIAGVAAPMLERSFGPYLRATRNLPTIALDGTLPPDVAQFRVTLRLVASHVEPIFCQLLLYRTEAARMRGRRRVQSTLAFAVRLVLRTLELVLVSAVIELTMALPMAMYFHRVTVFGLMVNVLVIPLLALLLPGAFVTLGTLLSAPGLAVVPAALTAAVLHLITTVIRNFSVIGAGDFRIPGPGLTAAVASLLLLAFAVCAMRSPRYGLALGIPALLAAAGCVLLPAPLTQRDHALEVTAIDVGQGDSLLVVSPSGKTLLIDAGGPTGGAGVHGNFEMGEDVVSPYLWSRHIRRLDAVALTHAHSDHMGGMTAVLRNFRPRELWVGRNPHTPEYDALLAEAAQRGIAVRSFAAGDSYSFGQAEFHVLAPAPDYQPGARAANNDSLVLHVAYGKTSALLEGDAEAPSEARMLSEPGLAADLLKVGHHGSKTSSTSPFLHAVTPRYAVISVGLHNSYHHPRWETLANLQAMHARTYRTDLLGLSTFYLDGTDVFPASR